MLKQGKCKTGIRRKIVFIICLSHLIVMTAGMILAYFMGANLLHNIIGENYVQTSEQLANYVAEMLEEEARGLGVHAMDKLWRDTIAETNTRDESIIKKEGLASYFKDMDRKWAQAREGDPLVNEYLQTDLSIRLKEIAREKGDISELFVTDRFGGLVASSIKTSDFYQADEGWWQKTYAAGRGRIFIDDITFDESSQTWGIPLCVPVKDAHDNVIGVAKANVSVKRFFAPLETFKIGRTGHAGIINEKGDIIFHPGITPLSVKFASDDALSKLFKGRHEIISNYALHHYKAFVAVTNIPSPFLLERGITWRVLIMQDVKEVFAPLNTFIFYLIIALFILLLLTLPLGYFLGGVFVRPIQRLHIATEQITQGNWDYKIEVKTGDEIEEFADSFQEMVLNLKEKQKQLLEAKNELEDLSRSLEKKVRERTEDLTEAKDKLEKYSGDLEAALRIKSDFTSMVSHELRTPLTAIKESISIVLDGTAGSINAEQKDFLGMAKRNVDRLARLINDVLTFQKLESGRMEFTLEQNDLNDIVREVVNTMRSIAGSKGLVLELEIDDNLPKVGFDRDKIIQVLTNIVNNAVKFTECGSIKIRTSQADNSVRVSVKDTGEGIKKEDLPRLFQKFTQLKNGTERKTGGTGLGLAISREIIEAHKGKIWAESEFGKGTTFYFTLPIKGGTA